MIFDDTFLYCYECGLDFKHICWYHKVKWILNKKIDCPFTTFKLQSIFFKYTHDKTHPKCSCNHNDKKHIEYTLPDCLFMLKSIIYKNEISVWTLELISRGTMFGPFCGHISDVDCVRTDVYECSINGKAWLIHKSRENDKDRIVNGTNPFSSNWMRSVTCSMDCKEQNLVAVQYDGFIFYRACEDILANTELVVNREVQHERDVDIRKGRKVKKPKNLSEKFRVVEDEDIINKTILINENIVPFSKEDKLPANISGIDGRACEDQAMSEGFGKPSSILEEYKGNMNTDIKNVSSVISDISFNSNFKNLQKAKRDNGNIKVITNIGCTDFDKSFKFSETLSINNDDNISTRKRKSASILSNVSESLLDHNYYVTSKRKVIKCAHKENMWSSFHLNQSHPTLYNLLNYNSSNEVYESSNPFLDLSKIDDETINYIYKIIKLEPYLSAENIVRCIKEKFPLKESFMKYDLLDFLKFKKIREINCPLFIVSEDIISCVVKLYKKHSEWSFDILQYELKLLYPSSFIDVATIESIVRSNFSERKVNCIDKEIIAFIQKVFIKNRSITMPKLNFLLRDNFPDSKILSGIVIDQILEGLPMRIKSIVEVKKEVNKIVKDIFKDLSNNSKLMS